MFFGSRRCFAHDDDVRLEAINFGCKENYLLTHTESREKQKKQPIFNISMGNYYLRVLMHKEFSTASLTPSLKLKKTISIPD